MGKKFSCIVGLIVGIIVVGIGASVQDTSIYAIGENLKFGADFYTEMYSVTKDVGHAINYAINDLIYAISWLIISIGLIDICYFSYHLRLMKHPKAKRANAEREEYVAPAPRITPAPAVVSAPAPVIAPQAAPEAAEEETEPAPLHRLNISEMEDAVSQYLRRRVSITDISCTLVYVVPKSTGKPREMYLKLTTKGKRFSSLNLPFFDLYKNAYYLNGMRLALDETWLCPEDIFSFDPGLFKNFKTQVDDSE